MDFLDWSGILNFQSKIIFCNIVALFLGLKKRFSRISILDVFIKVFSHHFQRDMISWQRWRHFYCCLLLRIPRDGVWKSQKKSNSTLRAKRATFTFWVDKSLLKMPKMVDFGEFLKIWSLRSNSVTRQVSFNRTKIGGKCQY